MKRHFGFTEALINQRNTLTNTHTGGATVIEGVLHNLPPNTNQNHLHHLDLAYQYIFNPL